MRSGPRSKKIIESVQTEITQEVVHPAGVSAAALAVSANGTTAGTGILWAAMSTQNSATGPVPGMLRAFDAVSLTELWNSTMNPADDSGMLAKFCVPTVVNGKVYLATFSNQLNVYGLHPCSKFPGACGKDLPLRNAVRRAGGASTASPKLLLKRTILLKGFRALPLSDRLNDFLVVFGIGSAVRP
jgi:hypothetical protein